MTNPSTDSKVTAPVSTEPDAEPRLLATHATLGYDKRIISTDLSVSIPDESFTVIVGPNACGKSTLLRGLSRLLKPSQGKVLLDGADIQRRKSKEVARELGLLPQSSIAPDGITVADLVSRGRYPYQTLLTQWTDSDERAVANAMAATQVSELSDRLVDELSGGQRQRVWVAMALAQETDILLLDEPTTYLDVTHQVELLELFTDLNLSGRTMIAVLHDLNQACRYGNHMIAMRDGSIVASGAPEDIVTAEMVEEVFGLKCIVVPDPIAGTPAVVPRGRDRSAAQSSTARTAKVHSSNAQNSHNESGHDLAPAQN